MSPDIHVLANCEIFDGSLTESETCSPDHAAILLAGMMVCDVSLYKITDTTGRSATEFSPLVAVLAKFGEAMFTVLLFP